MLGIRTYRCLLVILFISLSFGGTSFAENSRIVRYCADPAWAPYESIENGKHIGIAREYLDIIEQNSYFVFELVETSTWSQAIEFVKSNKCHMLPILNASPQREQYLAFTDVYFRAPNALYAHFDRPLIGNLTSIKDDTVGVVESYRMHNFLTDNFKGMKVVPVDNEEQGLSLLESRKLEFFVGSFHSTNRIIQHKNFRHIRIVGIAELEDNLRIGVNLQHQHLIPELNLAISKITHEQHARIFEYLKQKNLISQTDYGLIAKAVGIPVIVVVILGIAYFRSVKQAAILADRNTALKALHQQLDEKNQAVSRSGHKRSLNGLI